MLLLLTLYRSAAHSKKGWTDGVIGRLWIEDFDKKTCDKANGRTWLLLVDGHNSHYMMDFLDYAREHNIQVLCYPSHSTHVYQGLDVVIFAPLKRRWSEERRTFEESKRQRVTKQNFVTIYGRAHQHVLTPELVKTAFRKTGVWPFSTDVVTKGMMAPSLETSSHGHLPLPQPSPVLALTSFMRKYRSNASAGNLNLSEGSSQVQTDAPPMQGSDSVAKDAVEALASTSASFLLDETPLTSADCLPTYAPILITPTRKRHHSLLDEEPQTLKERAYQDELRAAYSCEEGYKHALHGMQSTIVLQSMYCDRISEQLAAQDEAKKARKEGWLVGNGLPRLLTGDKFYQRVVDHERAAVQDKVANENRRKQKEQRSALLAEWKEVEEARKQRNKEQKAAYREQLALWTEEKERAKQESRQAQWKKPTMGKLEKPLPKPACGRAEVDGDEGDEDEEHSDMDDPV